LAGTSTRAAVFGLRPTRAAAGVCGSFRYPGPRSYRPKDCSPCIELAPLPAGAQFLNVIESIFSGMSRAVIHNSDYPSLDAARTAIDRYFSERNTHFAGNPKRAGSKIWGKERVPSEFHEELQGPRVSLAAGADSLGLPMAAGSAFEPCSRYDSEGVRGAVAVLPPKSAASSILSTPTICITSLVASRTRFRSGRRTRRGGYRGRDAIFVGR
jgi:hypothetical protein